MAHNPYAPPKAQDLQSAPPTTAEVVYAGFWRRVGTFFLDALMLSPLIGASYLAGQQTRLGQLYMFVPGLVVNVLFNVYLVRRFGGTPGRLLLGTRITMVDGSPVTLHAAALRYSVLFVLGAAVSIATLMGVAAMSDEQYFSLGYLERARKTLELVPAWYQPISVLVQIWVWSEFVTMYFNKKRQAFQDLMAGTVVVRTGS